MVFNPPEAMRQMIEDLSAVAKIPAESIELLSQQLEQQSGFLTDESLMGLVSGCIADDAGATAAFNALQNLRPDAPDQILETVQAWRRANERNTQRFPDELFAALKQTLPRLVREYPALSRMQKADRLRNMLGDELKGVAFICDARPVYNDSRDRIEGMIPLTTMKLVYERQNLATEEIEVTVTPDQLRNLISEAQKAEKKLGTLRESIAEWIQGGCVEGGN